MASIVLFIVALLSDLMEQFFVFAFAKNLERVNKVGAVETGLGYYLCERRGDLLVQDIDLESAQRFSIDVFGSRSWRDDVQVLLVDDLEQLLDELNVIFREGVGVHPVSHLGVITTKVDNDGVCLCAEHMVPVGISGVRPLTFLRDAATTNGPVHDLKLVRLILSNLFQKTLADIEQRVRFEEAVLGDSVGN